MNGADGKQTTVGNQSALIRQHANKILFVKNLNFAVTGAELYELFGKFGIIQQIRIGNEEGKTKGTAYIVFEQSHDAKTAFDRLNGFHLQGRYLIIQPFSSSMATSSTNLEERRQQLETIKRQNNID